MDRNKKVRVGHICVEVSNLKKSDIFYKTLLKKLDFKIIMNTDESIGYSNNDMSIWLCTNKKNRVIKKQPKGDEFVIAEHIALLLPNRKKIDDSIKRLEKAGFKTLFTPEEHPEFIPGYYSASICDPDNYVIELYIINER